jgi:hypothetical protein
MKKFRLLIIMGDKAWTFAALHLACAGCAFGWVGSSSCFSR